MSRAARAFCPYAKFSGFQCVYGLTHRHSNESTDEKKQKKEEKQTTNRQRTRLHAALLYTFDISNACVSPFSVDFCLYHTILVLTIVLDSSDMCIGTADFIQFHSHCENLIRFEDTYF